MPSVAITIGLSFVGVGMARQAVLHLGSYGVLVADYNRAGERSSFKPLLRMAARRALGQGVAFLTAACAASLAAGIVIGGAS